MKKEMIKYLNKLETKDFSAHLKAKNGEVIWSISISKENFYIEISNDLYEEKKIKLAFHKNYNDVKISVETQEIQNFINTLRKKLESESCRKNASEEKREELINIFKQAKTIDKFLKESVTKIEGNEEKMFCFRSFDNPERYELQQLKFHHVYATEMTRDKRLTNEF